MGACCSKGESPAETRELAPHPQSQPNPPVIDQPVVELPPSRPRSRQSELPPSRPRSRQSSIKHVRESPQVERTSSHQRSRARSAPQKPQREEAPPLPSERPRVKSSVASSSRNPSLDHSQTSAEHSRTTPRRPTMSYPARRPLNSTVRQVLPEHFRFRILVVGKSGSGKSSLIRAIFKVAAAPERADINFEFRPDDNRYLIVHEFSGLDSESLHTIRDFISRRTDPNRTPSDRLHAVWICVPASDAVAGRVGDGVEEILSLGTVVPVVVVLTKFDVVVGQVRLDSPSSESQARARAHTSCEESCRHIFHKEPRDVPVQIVSEKSRYIDLIDSLVVTTDSFITNSRGTSARSSGRGAKQRVGAVPLAWSAALRVNHDIIIQTSIEVGRSRYWRNLWSSVDFADQTLKNCVKIIHDDIVEIWNLNDSRYLLGERFKVKMSHLVKDLAVSARGTPGSSGPTGAGGEYAEWGDDVYRGGQENVRCVVGYIVDLTVIMDGIFRMAPGDTPKNAQRALDHHVRSGHRDAIHRDIQSFITEAFAIRFSVPQKDLILERIIDLIKQHCVPPSVGA